MSSFGHIAFAARTDVGKKRKNNEDAFGTFPDAGIFCVADGMGGGDDGEIASAAVVKGVEDVAKMCVPPPGCGYAAADVAEVLEAGLSKASEWMFNRAAEKRLSGCGSTFVGVVFDAAHPDQALAVHAGDSRLYILHGKSIRQVTRDHSAAAMMGVKDERKINPMFRSMVINAVGIKPKVEVETTPFKVSAGDRIVICSDGLSRMVPDKKIASVSRGHADVDEAADALVSAALEAGGIDNVTVVLLEVGELPQPAEAQGLPEPAAELMGDDKDAADRTDSTDASTDAATDVSDCPTEGESQTMQTMQTVQPVIARTKFKVSRRLPDDTGCRRTWMSGRRLAVIALSVLAPAVAIVAALFVYKAVCRRPTSSAVEPPPAVAANGGESASETLEGLLAASATNEVVAPHPAPAVEPPPAPVVEPPPAEPPRVVEPPPTPAAKPSAPIVKPPAPAVKPSPAPVVEPQPAAMPSSAELLSAACVKGNVSRLIAVIRRYFTDGGVPLEYRDQVERLERSARTCAGSRTAKSAENAAVDIRFALIAAADARKAMSSRRNSAVMRKWLADWDQIVSGDARDEEVQKACARLLSDAEEVWTP